MDYEKKYKEKLKAAKYWYDASEGDIPAVLEEIFPELNNDEMIRKELIDYFSSFHATDTFRGISWDRVVAWLEKQGEQKPTIITPKFRVGDEIKTNNEEPLTITKIDEKGYWSEDLFICGFDEECIWDLVGQKTTDKVEPKFKVGDWIIYKDSTWKICNISLINYYELLKINNEVSTRRIEDVDKNAHLWTIEHAKPGDVLACSEEILLFKSYLVQGRISLYCWYNGQTNNFHSKGVDDTLLTTRNKISLATKEQRDTLMKAMAEAGYTFDFEKKELKKVRNEKQIKKKKRN